MGDPPVLIAPGTRAACLDLLPAAAALLESARHLAREALVAPVAGTDVLAFPAAIGSAPVGSLGPECFGPHAVHGPWGAVGDALGARLGVSLRVAGACLLLVPSGASLRLPAALSEPLGACVALHSVWDMGWGGDLVIAQGEEPCAVSTALPGRALVWQSPLSFLVRPASGPPGVSRRLLLLTLADWPDGLALDQGLVAPAEPPLAFDPRLPSHPGSRARALALYRLLDVLGLSAAPWGETTEALHLVRIGTFLAHWRRPVHEVLAGLVSTLVFGRSRPSPLGDLAQCRTLLTRVVGAPSFALAARYSALPPSFLAELAPAVRAGHCPLRLPVAAPLRDEARRAGFAPFRIEDESALASYAWLYFAHRAAASTDLGQFPGL